MFDHIGFGVTDHEVSKASSSPPTSGGMVEGHRFNVFGRVFVIRREANRWQAYVVGPEGTRVPAGFVVPDFVEDAELEQFLFDLFHESATPGNGEVRRIP